MLAGSVGLAFAQSQGEPNSTEPAKSATKQEADTERWPWSLFKPERPNPESAPSECPGRETACREWEDLKSQRRMADAAEKQLDLVAYQNLITTVESGLLVLTIIFTGWAAIMAGISARAAQQSAEALPILERAYIAATTISSNIRDQLDISTRGRDPEIAVKIKFTNYGKTAAFIKEISHDLIHKAALVEPVYTRLAAVPREFVLGPETPTDEYRIPPEKALGQGGAASVADGKSFLLFYGRVVYEDIFGKEHVTPWCFFYDRKTGLFTEYGDHKYNKRT